MGYLLGHPDPQDGSYPLLAMCWILDMAILGHTHQQCVQLGGMVGEEPRGLLAQLTDLRDLRREPR